MMSARFRRHSKRAAKSLRSKRLISQRCEVGFQFAALSFQLVAYIGQLQEEILNIILFASSPCIPDLLMEKDFQALVLHVSELPIALPKIPHNSPQSRIALLGLVPSSSPSPCTHIPRQSGGRCTLNEMNVAGHVGLAPPAFPNFLIDVVVASVAKDNHAQDRSS
uniref:Uncharacterized protein n=1 Tax=Vitis vinifera TaxID=29760 RepID=A5AJB1_VITVI|nr:hypothetical protein VITISV_039303 [Vitis vinifera]